MSCATREYEPRCGANKDNGSLAQLKASLRDRIQLGTRDAGVFNTPGCALMSAMLRIRLGSSAVVLLSAAATGMMSLVAVLPSCK